MFTEKAKKGNEELENWLAGGLKPRVDFKFIEVSTDKGTVVVMEIPAAVNTPTSFKGIEFIRVGSYKKTGRIIRKKSVNYGFPLNRNRLNCE
ncbi:MAG: helix-turn-helix domain-containing protein [Lachnospira sp.]